MIRKTKFLAKEAVLRAKYMLDSDCIFCKIVDRKIKADIVLESDQALAFNDANPVADTHVLIVPKKHIDSVLTISAKESAALIAMYNIVGRLVQKGKIDAFKLVFNGGKFQHVPHLHMHLLSGKEINIKNL